MHCYCLSYTDHTYNNLNKQPKVTVIVLSYTDHTYTNLNKQQKGSHRLSYYHNTYDNLD